VSEIQDRVADIGWFLGHPECRAFFRLASAYDKTVNPRATVTLVEKRPASGHDGFDHRRTCLVVQAELIDYLLREGEDCLGVGHWAGQGRAAVEILLRGGGRRILN
jgi:hypothetical protein